MAKNLKLKIKNEQIAKAVNLAGIKDKLKKLPAPEVPEEQEIAEKKAGTAVKKPKVVTKPEPVAAPVPPETDDLKPRVRARTKSAFVHEQPTEAEEISTPFQEEESSLSIVPEPQPEPIVAAEETAIPTEAIEPITQKPEEPTPVVIPEVVSPPIVDTPPPAPPVQVAPPSYPRKEATLFTRRYEKPPVQQTAPRERLGPTGRHVRDLIPKPVVKPPSPAPASADRTSDKPRPRVVPNVPTKEIAEDEAKKVGNKKFKEYRDIKPTVKRQETGVFDSRARQGLRVEEERSYRRRRHQKAVKYEAPVTRPTSLKIRLPITIKDFAVELKLKASQLLEKLFLQGAVFTINDILDDPMTVQLLGTEFGCEITIDTAEEERIRITDKTVREEVLASDPSQLTTRPPVVTFMGHVDHGKTSLIDAIRKSSVASGEAGAITQHIGAFRCHTSVGDLTVIDTPGHEAFSAMRARGADVTDIVVLVIAGDEGIRAQTVEAINHAKAAGVTIVVALNKCDKPNFDPELVYRQLSEHELLAEAWGGTTITVNCSATTGEGIQQLLEMLALQAEVLELRAAPTQRARGRVIESEMHKGLGATATLLVQNGTLNHGDALVFDIYWGRVKTMRDEFGKELASAPPSCPVEITGLSGLPEAGQEFIAVATEKAAREIAEARALEFRQKRLSLGRTLTVDSLVAQAAEHEKKVLNVILRADVQGSLEALKTALQKIHSEKATLNIIHDEVGEISESDVQLAATSKAVILGFHTQIESHAESLIKEAGIKVLNFNIIYHALDEVKKLMQLLLDKLPQENEKGKAEIRAVFKSSAVGLIAGCQVIEGSISRNHRARVVRKGEVIWKGGIASLRRVNEDVREVQKGIECGILLDGFKDAQEGDVIEAYEIVYIEQQL